MQTANSDTRVLTVSFNTELSNANLSPRVKL